MWLAEQLAISGVARADDAAAGEVSIGGDAPAVVTDAERRGCRVMAPGGVYWVPCAGQRAVVLGGGENLVAGVIAACPVALAPGELCLAAQGGAKIVLKNTGRIELSGDVYVNGKKWEAEECLQSS